MGRNGTGRREEKGAKSGNEGRLTTVLSLAVSSKILSWLTGILSRKVNLEDAIDSEGLILEALDGVGTIFISN